MQVFVFVIFTQRNFSLCFQIHKDWTSDSKFCFKNYSSEKRHPFIFLECAEKKPCELKRVQILLFITENVFFSMKSVEFSQNSLGDDCQIVWSLINCADCNSNNESPSCYISCICLSNESDKHPLTHLVLRQPPQRNYFICTVANDLPSLQMLDDFLFPCSWIFSHYSSSYRNGVYCVSKGTFSCMINRLIIVPFESSDLWFVRPLEMN